MKVSTMRHADAGIGVPLCLLASGLQAVARALRRPSDAGGPPRSVLVIKLSELGALVTLGPAMRALTEMAGRDNIYFLTFGESRALLEALDYIPRENIFVLRTEALVQLALDALRCLVRLRGKRIACSVDFDFFARATALLGWLCGCRRRVGCHAYFGEGPYRGSLLTHRVKFNPHLHVSRMFEILARAAAKPSGEFPRMEFVPDPAEAPRERFRPSPGESAGVQKLMTEAGVVPGNAVILLNTNISDRETIPLRKWPDECYLELAQLILNEMPDAFILMTGTAREAAVVSSLESRVGHARCRSVAGKTTLRELLTLYSMSDAMVTNDSGPAHFAALTDMDVIVLFGPETPLMWKPLGAQATVMYRNLACSPCFTVYNGRQSKCRRNACMDFTPRQVYDVLRTRLAARKER